MTTKKTMARVKRLNEDIIEKWATFAKTIRDGRSALTEEINYRLQSLEDEYRDELWTYEPPFRYTMTNIDSDTSTNPNVVLDVWISYIGVDPNDISDANVLKAHFLNNTDFDYVEIYTRDSGREVTYSVPIYDYDL